jgi:type III secretion system HrpE/YscL family protein
MSGPDRPASAWRAAQSEGAAATFLLWHRQGDVRIAATRRVLRAAEVPLLADAQTLRDRLEQLYRTQAQHLAEAAAQARHDGHALGIAEGSRELAERLSAHLVSLAEAAATERERMRNEVGALALQVVRKLLGQFADESVLVALADAAATEVLPSQPLAVVVHPDRCDAVRERLAARPAAALRCEVRADPSLELDGCRLETEHGSVDVSLESQLARLTAAWGAADVEAAA